MKLAVVLFNLGGPDSLSAVRPFLFNLFNDPAIIGAPAPIRWCLAQWISRRRAPVARKIYEKLGGRSPLLELTQRQAAALETLLGETGEARVFVAMRYWHPRSGETARLVKEFAPDHIVLLPLYPQYSTTTTGSSLKDWRRAAARSGLDAPTSAVCCYPTEAGWIRAQARLIRAGLDKASDQGEPRVLFSAHGLPKQVIEGGDPYQWQVEATAAAVVEELAMPELDWVVCYQSRVGPMEWIGPSTEDELARAAQDRVPVVVAPIAFVSEHSETLVELDVEYREAAEKMGVPGYVRVPAVGTEENFVEGLAEIVEKMLEAGPPLCSDRGRRRCPAAFGRCAMGGET